MLIREGIIFILTLAILQAHTQCPNDCSCPLDEKGRWQVLCLDGGLNDPLPVLQMPSKAEVLIVKAPKGRENTLTLGPIFRGLQSLEEVHVVNSGIPALGEHTFWGLRKLHLLNVSYNNIVAILPTNFRGPEALQILDLGHNNIESSPSAVFRYLKRLRELNLSHNRIPELVPRIFFGLSSLEKLDISNNPLGELPYDRFTDLPALTELRCANCGLLTITESLLKELPNIQMLDLSGNRLISIPPLKIAMKLSVLWINGNLITKIRKEDLNHIPIQELYVSHNRISVIEEGAFENSSLTLIDVSYNRLSLLNPKVIEKIISSLRFIDFSGNSLHIDQLMEILPKARQLRYLGIGDLGLTQIPSDLLRRSRNLRYLNISSNYLSKFPHQLLYSTPNLQVLDLSANSFRGLHQNVVSAFSAMSSLDTVRLERNPWQCTECHISHLVNWLKSSSKQPHSLSSCKKELSSMKCLKCVGPEKLAGQAMVLLNEEMIEECTNAAHSIWPVWQEGQNEVIQGDDPHSSVDKRADTGNSTNLEIVASFFKDHLALLVGVACGLVLAMMLVVITALVCSRRQSAYYYTSEEDIEKKEKLVGRNNNDSPVSSPAVVDASKVPPYEPMAISKVHSRTPICPGSSLKLLSPPSLKKPSIATIEEMNSLDV